MFLKNIIVRSTFIVCLSVALTGQEAPPPHPVDLPAGDEGKYDKGKEDGTAESYGIRLQHQMDAMLHAAKVDQIKRDVWSGARPEAEAFSANIKRFDWTFVQVYREVATQTVYASAKLSPLHFADVPPPPAPYPGSIIQGAFQRFEPLPF